METSFIQLKFNWKHTEVHRLLAVMDGKHCSLQKWKVTKKKKWNQQDVHVPQKNENDQIFEREEKDTKTKLRKYARVTGAIYTVASILEKWRGIL